MGLLDSNKLNIQQKNGQFSCDLSSSGSQGSISFNGVGYTRLSLQVEDIPNDVDIIIVAKGGIVSTYNTLKCYNVNGEEVIIKENGTYIVDVTGLTGLYFQVTRLIVTGTCTINWSLSNSDNVYKETSRLDSIINNMQRQEALNDGKKTYDVSAVGNLETFYNENKCGCFVVNVETISSGAVVGILDNKNRSCTGYDSAGNLVVNGASSPGIYYYIVDISIPSIILRCGAAGGSGATAEIRTGWIKEIPNGVGELKPIQLIKSFTAEVTSTSEFTLISQNDTTVRKFLKSFKYFFYSYFLINGSSSVIQTCHISIQPYHDYNGTFRAGKYKEYSVENGYSYQSEWFEINSDTLRLFVQNEGVNEGDTIMLNLYGVR